MARFRMDSMTRYARVAIAAGREAAERAQPEVEVRDGVPAPVAQPASWGQTSSPSPPTWT